MTLGTLAELIARYGGATSLREALVKEGERHGILPTRSPRSGAEGAAVAVLQALVRS